MIIMIPQFITDFVKKRLNIKSAITIGIVSFLIYKAVKSFMPKKESLHTEYVEPLPEDKADPKELKMGIKVEMEHTDNPEEAKKIALQHLAEKPNYYTLLLKHVESWEEKLQLLKEGQQSLFRADDVLPSDRLKKDGFVFGFSTLEFAKGWKKVKNKKHIYTFTTDNYKLDKRVYLRKIDNGNKISDNEYIVKSITSEKQVE